VGRSGSTNAYVRLVEPAISDLEGLLRADPQIVRQVLKKMLLLERDPQAGEPLLGELVGCRKLVVGDRHWRIVWRVTTDDAGGLVVDIAEVWAAGARADAEVYAEMASRVARLPPSPPVTSLAEVVALLGRSIEGIAAAAEPIRELVPPWLADRLRHQVGLSPEHIAGLEPEAAMVIWEQHITQPR
jgi:mRNA interferase RelE/StbE